MLKVIMIIQYCEGRTWADVLGNTKHAIGPRFLIKIYCEFNIKHFK